MVLVGQNIKYNSITSKIDQDNKNYARWMTEQIKEIELSYEIYNECQFFHDGITINNIKYSSAREYLDKFHSNIFHHLKNCY